MNAPLISSSSANPQAAEKARLLAEALPYIQRFHGKTIVIKFGGNALTDELLKAGGVIPVVAPIGTGADGTAYNINADLVAGKLAEILAAEKLVVLTNPPGVVDKDGKLLTGLTPRKIDDLVKKGVISGGMLPKIGSALDAARNGVKSVHIIDGRVPHALLLEVLTDQGVGTLIRSK